MKHSEFFRTHPVFTGAELDQHLAVRGDAGPRTREALLAYHRRAGNLIAVRRGLFAVVPPGSDPKTFPVDPFLVASKLRRDSVISHHAALQLLGRAHSVHGRTVYSASRPLDRFAFRGHVFQGVRFPKALRRAGQEFCGVQTADRFGLDVRVTSLERTLVDILGNPRLGGGWEEIWRSLESVEFFDLDEVVEYAILLDNATTAAKVGFFLEQHREGWMVEERHLKRLRDLRPRRPHYLERSRRAPGRLVSEWNLVVPPEVLQRSWEEIL